MKKLYVLLLIFGLSLGFMACNSTESETNVDFESDEQVFTLQALSGAALLDYNAYETVSFIPLADVTTETTDGEEDVIVEEIDDIDQYLDMIENFLGDNQALSVEQLTSDRDEWDNLISYSTVDLLGNDIVYYLYFNETEFVNEDPGNTDVTTTEAITTEEETTTEETTTEAQTTQPLAETSPGERNFFFEDEDDDEVVYLMTGVIVYGETEYQVEGKRVVEDNGDEIFIMRSFVDRENFVKAMYRVDAEDNKEKFFFEVVSEGIVITRSRVMVIEEDGKLIVNLNLVEGSNSGRYFFRIMEEADQTIIHIRYDVTIDGVKESGNIHVFATEDSETGEIVYTYRVLNEKTNAQNKYTHEEQKRHRPPRPDVGPRPNRGNM